MFYYVVCFSDVEYMSYLYILEINPLSIASFATSFSHSKSCLFILLMVSFAVRKLLSLVRSHFIKICFYFHYCRRCGEGNGSPLQYSCLENPMDTGPGGLQSMGSQRVRHDWATSLPLSTFMHWRRKWQPTPVFLPGESQGRGSLVGCRLWGRTESDTTEAT